MRTTFNLPDGLVNEVKVRAERDGRSLDDAAADLLRKGLAAGDERPAKATKSAIKTHPKTGLPYIECPPDAPARTMTISELVALERKILDRGRACHRERRSTRSA
jgi:plasmid stability protein